MDSLTHILTGVVIAGAVNDEKLGQWGTIAGAAMGIFPDADFAFSLFNRHLHVEYHRAFTHSLILLPFYALLFSWIFIKLSRRHKFLRFYRLCVIVLMSHIMLDLFTSYGTMILSPFSNLRFSLDLIFLVDLIFFGILMGPWIVSLFWKRKSRWICRSSLVLLFLYILFCSLQHHQAVQLARAFAGSLKIEIVEVAALPQPLSPFRWANYVETAEGVYQGYVDLLGRNPFRPWAGHDDTTRASFFLGRWAVLKDLYHPPSDVRYSYWSKRDGSPWVERALTTEGAKFYFWFARFPIARSVDSDDGTHRVELADVRYLMPRFGTPFTYYVEFDDRGNIRSEGFVGKPKKEPL